MRGILGIMESQLAWYGNDAKMHERHGGLPAAVGAPEKVFTTPIAKVTLTSVGIHNQALSRVVAVLCLKKWIVTPGRRQHVLARDPSQHQQRPTGDGSGNCSPFTLLYERSSTRISS